MRVIFNPNVTREFSRNKTISKKPLIVAEDVNPTDDVELKFDDDAIRVVKTGKDEEVTSDTEWLYIGRAFGLYGENKDLKSVVEFILCDEYIAVRLVKGAITVHPDDSKPDDVILVSVGVDENTLPAPYLSNIKWADRDYLASLCKYWGDFADSYPADYMYQAVVSGAGGATSTVRLAKLSMQDISWGMLALKKERSLEIERKRKLKAVSSMFVDDSAGVKFDTFDEGGTYDEDEDEMYQY